MPKKKKITKGNFGPEGLSQEDSGQGNAGYQGDSFGQGSSYLGTGQSEGTQKPATQEPH